MLIEKEADKLLLIPGPTPVHREILSALAEPTISHTSAAMAAIVQRCLAGLRSVAAAPAAHPFIFGGAGTLAMEAAVVNVVAPGECLLVASNGYFGDRFEEIARAHGIDTVRVAAPWGEAVQPEQLEEHLRAGRVRAVAMTHVDTSTGVTAPIAALAGVAREHGAIVILDAVCSLGGMPVDMERHSIDIVLTGAQKALGVPPGLSLLLVSDRALAARQALPRVPAYYADLLNWQQSMLDPQTYFSTHAVNLFYALDAAIRIIEGEGLPHRFARHERLAHRFRAGMAALGFEPLTVERWLAPTLSVLTYPDGVVDESFRTALSRRGVVAAPCFGEFRGKGIRFGHMGNITEAEISQALATVEETLADVA